MFGGTSSILLRLSALLSEAMARAAARHQERYEPAHHYMRGPGPKCREKERIGA